MKYKFTFYAFWICIAAVIYVAFYFYPRWEKSQTEATLSWDVSGYYMYLPATFIYKDLKKLGFQDSIINKYKPSPSFEQAFIHKNSGNYVMKYASGQALVMSPGFFVGDIWAQNSEYPRDGFSKPYQKSVGIWMLLLGILGLWGLKKLLIYYFEDKTVAILLIVLVLGTNYLNYIAVDQGMTHSTLFTIYVYLILLTKRFYQRWDMGSAIGIGLLTGLATLIRPTEIITIFIPIFWGLHSTKDLKSHFVNLSKSKIQIISSIIAFTIIAAIQPMYWKYASGEWFVYSYGDQGFSWLKPHFQNYVFSYRCGWLRYTPMMFLPFIGLYHMYKRNTSWSKLFTFYTLLAFYIVISWNIWDYGGTAGRAMVQYYPILLFSIGVLYEEVRKINWLKYLFFSFVLLFGYVNVWWVYHAHAGEVQALELSKAYYWNKVGRWRADIEDKKLLDNKHVYRGELHNLKTLLDTTFVSKDSIGEKVVIKDWILTQENQHSPTLYFNYDQSINNWIRIYTSFYAQNKEWEWWRQTQFIVDFYDNEQKVQSNMVRLHRFIDSPQHADIYLDAKVPKKWTHFTIHFWNADSPIRIDIESLKMIHFTTKE